MVSLRCGRPKNASGPTTWGDSIEFWGFCSIVRYRLPDFAGFMSIDGEAERLLGHQDPFSVQVEAGHFWSSQSSG